MSVTDRAEYGRMKMKLNLISCLTLTALVLVGQATAAVSTEKTEVKKTRAVLNVVTTLPDYKVIAMKIGRERVAVTAIVSGDQDAHFIRPKPSFVTAVGRCDVLIATGLDLELWLPTVVDKSGNTRVRSGQPGYIAASQGMKLLEKPKVMSHVTGGVHINGNPHVTCSPLQMRIAARNIARGLIKNDSAGQKHYEKNLKEYLYNLDCRMFGDELVKIIGGDLLSSLAGDGKLIPFLKKHRYKKRPLIEKLSGWMKKMLSLRGTNIVTYHKNWAYFMQVFGLVSVGTVEPKPGIPPSPKHVSDLIRTMRQKKIKIIMAANYFDQHKVKTVAKKVGARAVIVPVYAGGTGGGSDYFDLVDCWVNGLLKAAENRKILKGDRA